MNPNALSEHAERVLRFMFLAGQPTPVFPSVPGGKIRERCVRLLMEELLEFAKAADVDIRVYANEGEPLRLQNITFDSEVSGQKVDMIGVADGVADLSVVTMGAMLSFGISDVLLLQEVDENNLKKFGPGGRKDPATGKWLKPPDHQPPDIGRILKAQGWCNSEGGNDENHQVPVSSDGDKQGG